MNDGAVLARARDALVYGLTHARTQTDEEPLLTCRYVRAHQAHSTVQLYELRNTTALATSIQLSTRIPQGLR